MLALTFLENILGKTCFLKKKSEDNFQIRYHNFLLLLYVLS